MSFAGLTRRALIVSAVAAPFDASAQIVERDRTIARVQQGWLAGVSEAGVFAYKGVPYAAPPVEARRFRPPAKAQPWEGIRQATTFGPAPLQPPPPPGMTSQAFLGAETSEDCLYLNIWRPREPGPHPVFVWIHGGGNFAGSASQITDGAVFARSGIVCVTVGYRLGAFGFLELGRVLGPGYRGSSVNGLRDQIAALQWVRANIAAFDGDPGRVTIGGQSAGGKNVVALMASPLTRGLFSSAIVESGGQTVHDLRGAEQVTELLVKSLAAHGEASSSLPTLSGEALSALQIELLKSYDRPFPFRAVTGTDVLPEAPLDAFRKHGASARRLLIGTNQDESILFLDRRSAGAPVTQRDLANVDVAAARPIAAAYDRAFPTLDALHRRVRFVTAEEYGVISERIAEALRSSANVWVYRFAAAMSAGPLAGWSPHGAEVIHIWKAYENPLVRALYGDSTPQARALGEEMNARWCAFIRGGTPDLPGAPHWPRFDGSKLLLFEETASKPAKVDLRDAALWEGV